MILRVWSSGHSTIGSLIAKASASMSKGFAAGSACDAARLRHPLCIGLVSWRFADDASGTENAIVEIAPRSPVATSGYRPLLFSSPCAFL